MRNKRNLALISVFVGLLAACSSVSQPEASYDPSGLQFSGERAFAVESEFVTSFPNRHSGQPNNRAAAEWLKSQFEALGLACEMQEWTVVNYSLPVDLRNVACTLPGASQQQILIVAHHDQAPTTIQGADNDGSGIAILLQLAEIFGREEALPYTLTFVATDGEEYGMLGTYHYVKTHPNTKDILVGMSLDNLGREYYDAMSIELIGQYRNYGPIWVPLAAQAAAEAGGLWQVHLRAPLDQMLDQAGPISFMDQGPMLAAGIPAVGFTGHVPAKSRELHYHLWHDPDDSMEHQTAETLGNAGLVAEAFVRQLFTMDEFPREFGPYIYFEDSGQSFSGLPLWAIFLGFVALFFVAAYCVLRVSWTERVASWRAALPHLLSLWLPLLGSIVLTYLLVAVGIMDQYDVYPATSKDLHIYNPRWEAVILFLAGLALLLWLGRWLAAKYSGSKPATHAQSKSLAFLVIGLGALYVFIISPFSLLFLAPTFFWLLIAGRKGAAGKALDVVFFLLGGLVFYGLFYFFGFVIYDYNFAFAWFMLMMFSIQMTSFWTAVVITAVVGAGLSLVVEPVKAMKGTKIEKMRNRTKNPVDLKIELSDFIEENHKLLTVLGVFSALTIFASNLSLVPIGNILSFLFLTLSFFIWLEIWRKFPRKNGSTSLGNFEIFLTITIAVIGIYWIFMLHQTWPSGIVIVTWSIIMSIFSRLMKFFDLFTIFFGPGENRTLRYAFGYFVIGGTLLLAIKVSDFLYPTIDELLIQLTSEFTK